MKYKLSSFAFLTLMSISISASGFVLSSEAEHKSEIVTIYGGEKKVLSVLELASEAKLELILDEAGDYEKCMNSVCYEYAPMKEFKSEINVGAITDGTKMFHGKWKDHLGNIFEIKRGFITVTNKQTVTGTFRHPHPDEYGGSPTAKMTIKKTFQFNGIWTVYKNVFCCHSYDTNDNHGWKVVSTSYSPNNRNVYNWVKYQAYKDFYDPYYAFRFCEIMKLTNDEIILRVMDGKFKGYTINLKRMKQ